MPKVSAILNFKDPSGSDKQKSFTDINPEATATQIKSFAQAMNTLTDNVYEATYRVEKIHCDSEAGDEKQTPTLTATPNPISWPTFKAAIANHGSFEITLNYDGDASGFFIKNPYATFSTLINNGKIVCSSPYQAAQLPDYSQAIADNPLVVETEETDNYKAASLTITFTA